MKTKILLIFILISLYLNCTKNEVSPVANFKVNNNVIYVNDTIQFLDSSLNDPLKYTWYFEGGTPTFSTEKNPKVVYMKPGNYFVILTVMNSAGRDSILKDKFIFVKDRFSPIANFIVNQNFIFANDTVRYLDSSLNKPTQYIWLFEGGKPNYSKYKNPTVIYKKTGTYSVSLIVSNNDGRDTIVKDNYIHVKNLYVGIIDSNLIYTDIEPYTTINFNLKTPYYFDLDHDGNQDLKFTLTYDIFCGLSAYQYSYFVEPVSSSDQILAYPFGSPKVLNINDTLNNQIGWTSSKLLLHSTDYSCIGKSWPGDGNWAATDKKFMGIKIKGKLGWIQLGSPAGYRIYDFGLSK